MNEFVIKDSGKRQEFESGMRRDTNDGKILYHLIASGPMFKRWANHLTGGARKYSADNWMQANSSAERDRFRESAFRHFMQWYYGETDEDHAAAVYFNINGAEYVKQRLSATVGKYDQVSIERSGLQSYPPVVVQSERSLSQRLDQVLKDQEHEAKSC